MKAVLAAAIAACVSLAAVSPADARGGCGPRFHPGPRGRCLVNRAGGFYRGHGYWDGRRYWQHRVRWHGGWRYR